jgi:hypothetical protein
LLLSVTAGARADDELDKALIRIERVPSFYARMSEAAQIDRPLLEVAEDRPRSAVRARGMELAREIYSVPRAVEDVRSAMGIAAKSPDAGRLPDIASRLDAIHASIEGKTVEELQALGKKWEARYRSRLDRKKIDAISSAMATPVLAGETVVTARRMKWVYETMIVETPARLRAVDANAFDAGLKTIMARTREPDHPNQPTPLRRNDMERMWREQARAVISQLDAQDVATLHRFYASPPVRRKIAALKTAFRTRNDTDGLSFMNRMLAEFRQR